VQALIVDDDPSVRSILRRLLTLSGHTTLEAEDGKQAIERLTASSVDVVITDLQMPHADGFEVLRRARELRPRTPVVVLTGEGSVRDCVAAMRAGAFNFLIKPFHASDLDEIVARALVHPGTTVVPDSPRGTGDGRPQLALIGDSPPLQAVIAMVERVAHSNSTVLLTGESGTGKEVVARLLHGTSGRSSGPFIAVNCGAIPETLVESELFGHVKGAFTGASETRPGRFLQAHGGTLFLDEVGELPLTMQVKLLRVLQEREVTAVGDGRSRAVDVRIVAATNLDLEAMVREGRFRQDLYYRLEVLPIHLPALRERSEDIPILARHFLDVMSRRLDRVMGLGDDALALFRLYAWPGNVREMENLFERLVILNQTGMITAEDLPARMRDATTVDGIAVAAAALARGPIDLPATMAAFESVLVDQAFRQAGGNKTHAAALLGIARTTLVEKLKRA
jgi:DNA-binding NtrC family response regulator